MVGFRERKAAFVIAKRISDDNAKGEAYTKNFLSLRLRQGMDPEVEMIGPSRSTGAGRDALPRNPARTPARQILLGCQPRNSRPASVIGGQEVPSFVLVVAQPVTPGIVVIHVEAMGRVSLGDRTVATDDRHVFIVVI